MAETSVHDDLTIEQELRAACEYALRWFEAWEQHANHENDFGGEHAVMHKLQWAIAEASRET